VLGSASRLRLFRASRVNLANDWYAENSDYVMNGTFWLLTEWPVLAVLTQS
jgi:hypothetical protein